MIKSPQTIFTGVPRGGGAEVCIDGIPFEYIVIAHRRGKLESNSYMHRIRKPKTSQPHPTAASPATRERHFVP